MAVDGIYIFFPVLLSVIFFIFKSFSSKNSLPPGPYPWPILGNILHMGKKPHISLTNFAQTYGPIISLKLGTQILVVGSSTAAAMEILKTNDRILSARHVPHAVVPKKAELNYLSMAWAFECNDGWRYLRSICRTELFSSKAIESQARLRERKVMDMVKFLSGMEGKILNVAEIVFATVFNMLGNIVMSKDFISLEEDRVGGGGMKGVMRRAVELMSSPNLSDFYPIFGALDLQGLKKKSDELTTKIYAMWEPIIVERRERKSYNFSGHQDFLDTLLDIGFSNDRINQLLQELFGAATDTSTSTIEWAMAELTKNSESMMKVREEIGREINQDFLNEYSLAQLPYLQACVKETLRLHPPAPFMIPHRASESCKVMNYVIPKNAQVLVNFWAISRDPRIWEDPLKFKPERFLNSSLDFKGNDFEFLPFGAGRRICPGLPMAARIVPLILASLILHFDWDLPNGNDPNDLDMTEKFGITLQKEQPLLLIPKMIGK